MSEYYLSEIMYELYGIADAVTNGKAAEERKKRHQRELERLDAVNCALMRNYHTEFDNKPE